MLVVVKVAKAPVDESVAVWLTTSADDTFTIVSVDPWINPRPLNLNVTLAVLLKTVLVGSLKKSG